MKYNFPFAKANVEDHQICFQPDEASPEEKKTRLKKADSIRRMLADSSATPVVRSKAHLNI